MGGVAELAVSGATTGCVVGPATGVLVGLGEAAEAIGLGTGAALGVAVGGAALAAIAAGVAITDAVQTNYNNVVDDSLTGTTIKAGESLTVQDSDSRWGFHNGVTDIAFLITTQPKVDPVTGIKSGGIIGSVFADNPTVGSTYAKVYPWDGSGDPVPMSTNDVDRITPSAGDPATRFDFKGGHLDIKYEGDTEFFNSGTKNWVLDLFAG